MWSNISLCRGAAGDRRLLLRVHPKEQTVCHRPRCSAAYSPQTGPRRLCTREFITLNNSYTSELHLSPIAVIYCEMLLPSISFRICPAPLRCNQQGSDCSPSSSSSSSYSQAAGCSTAHHWSSLVSSPFSGGECTTLTWRLVAMETQGAVAVATAFL